jgi:hypothetical protein
LWHNKASIGTKKGGLVGWFMLYGEQDIIAGMALVGIVVMTGLWLWLQTKIMKLIRSLRDK